MCEHMCTPMRCERTDLEARDVLFWGVVPNIPVWIGALVAAIATAWLGFIWFQKTRKGFADVL